MKGKKIKNVLRGEQNKILHFMQQERGLCRDQGETIEGNI